MKTQDLVKASQRGDQVAGERIIGEFEKCKVVECIGVPERSAIRDYSGQRMWRVRGHLFSAFELEFAYEPEFS